MAQAASLLSSLPSLWGQAYGAGLGVLASNASSKKQFKYQAALQRQAAELNYQYGLKSLENSPTSQRTGLESAGYNPMLAVQNATSGANSGWTSTGQAQSVDYAGSISSSIANAQSFKRLDNESKQADANVEAAEATAENQRAEAANRREENPYISERLKSEIGKIDSETEYNNAAIENMKSRLELDAALGFSGLDVQRRGQDKYYAGVVYNADTMKDVADNHSPSGKSISFRNYAGGVSDVLHSVGGFVPWYKYEDVYNVGSDGVVKGSKHKKSRKGRH